MMTFPSNKQKPVIRILSIAIEGHYMMCYILALTADPLFTLPKQNMQLIIERKGER